jgi:hypothetical protein
MELFTLNPNGTVPLVTMTNELEKRGVDYIITEDTYTGLGDEVVYASNPELLDDKNGFVCNFLCPIEYIRALQERCRKYNVKDYFKSECIVESIDKVNNTSIYFIKTVLPEQLIDIKYAMNEEQFKSFLKSLDKEDI